MHVALAALAIAFYWLLGNLPMIGNLQMGPLLTITIFGLLEHGFNNWFWKLLCKVKQLNLVDFGGRYRGTLIAGDGTRHEAKIVIAQTWQKIEIDFESGQATSKSFSAAIVNDRLKRGQIELVYNYFTTGRNDGKSRLDAHYGTAMLRLQDSDGRLNGEYFTEQNRDSYGILELNRE